MIDYVHEDVVDFDDLDDYEKDLVSLATNLLCALAFIGVSFIQI